LTFAACSKRCVKIWSSVKVAVPPTVRPPGLARRVHEVVDRLVRALAPHRDHQLVDGDDHQRGHGVAMVAGQTALDLAGDDHRRRAGDDVGIALLVEHVVVADGAAAAGAVVHDQRHRRPFVLVDDAGDHAHQVVGAAAGCIGNHHFHRALWIPGLRESRACA